MGAVSEIQRALGRIEGDVKAILAQVEAAEARGIKLEERVRKVEHRQAWYSGIGVALGTIGGWFGSSWVRTQVG
jgi:hypothetical protein